MRFLNDILIEAGLIVDGAVQINTIPAATTDTDKILVSDGGTLKFRTGSQIASDIDAMTKAVYDTDGDGIVDDAEKVTVIARNSTGSTIYKGTIVYLQGSTGNRPNMLKAQANNEATSSRTFGVVVDDVANNADGQVAALGTLHDLDTRSGAPNPFTSDTLLDGDAIWLSPTTAGYVTRTKPTAPNHAVFIGIVARTSPTNGRIVYRIQNGFELEELHNVSALTPNNNDGIFYNSATGLWEAKSIATAAGGTIGTVTSVAMTVPTGLQIGGSPITSSGTLALTFQTGYSIPTNVKQSNWDDAYTWVAAFPTQTGNNGKYLTTDGNSLSWATVTPGLTGSGATNYVPKWASSTSLGNSSIYMDGSNVAIGATTATAVLHVRGSASASVGGINFTTNSFTNGSSGTVIRINTDAAYGNTFGIISVHANGGTTSAPLSLNTTGGNVLIGTSTDSGFKLDVNGTARVGSNPNASQLTVNGATTTIGIFSSSDIYLNGASRVIYANGLTFNTANNLANNTKTLYLFTQQTPVADSGAGGVVDLVTLSMPVNNGTQSADSRALVIDFPVTTNLGTLTAIDAVSGLIRFRGLSGTGSRMVVADSSGVLSTQAIPAGTTTGSGTTNYVPKWTGASALGNSQIFDNGTNVGIGTTNPTQPLSILFNNSSASETGITVKNSNSLGRATISAYNDNNENGVFGIYGTAFPASTYRNNFVVGASKSLYFLSDGGIPSGGSSTINFITGGYENNPRLRITAAGRILIGTTTESTFLLDVNGTARVSTSAYFATSSGAVGIGTTSPAANCILHMQGNQSQLQARVQNSSTTGIANYSVLNNSNSFVALGVFGSAATPNGIIGANNSYVYSSVDLAIMADGAPSNIKFASGGNAERMRLTAAGRLLIGTTTESTFLLDVNGTARVQNTLTVTSSASDNVGLVVDPSTNGNSIIRFKRTATNKYTTFEYLTNNVARWAFGLRETVDEDFHIYNHAAANDVFRITNSTGNVSIGSTAASYKLDITGDLRNTTSAYFATSSGSVGIGTTSPTNALHIDKGNATASYLQFTAGTTTGQTATDGLIFGIDASGNAVLNNQDNLPIIFSTNNAERMRIQANSFIGIGTSSSSYALQITGPGTDLLYINKAGNYVKFGGMGSGTAYMHAFEGNFAIGNVFSGGSLLFLAGNSERARLTNSGRLLLGTTTESTFLLDVNGTARVSGTARVTSEFAVGGDLITGTDIAIGANRNAASEMRLYANARWVLLRNTATNLSIDWSNNTGGVPSRGMLLIAGVASNTIANAKFNSLGFIVAHNTADPSIDASAIMQADSTTKGFLPPRMTGAQAEAIATPAAGLLVYANNGNGTTITSTGWWGYDGSAWVKLN